MGMELSLRTLISSFIYHLDRNTFVLIIETDVGAKLMATKDGTNYFQQ
jgi:hypothetical protein